MGETMFLCGRTPYGGMAGACKEFRLARCGPGRADHILDAQDGTAAFRSEGKASSINFNDAMPPEGCSASGNVHDAFHEYVFGQKA